MNSTSALSVINVSKNFRHGREKTTVLHNVSFKVSEGETAVILGPSGSGKTTLLRILGGLSKPNDGQIIIGENNLYKMRDAKLSRYRNSSIGFVFQDYRLLPHYNALENVMMPLKIAGLSHKEQKNKALIALTRVGLADFTKRRVTELSGGQQQRVSIARAIAMQPQILVADEPTGNLDSTTGKEILELFWELQDTTKLTIVMVTHDENIARYADHIIRMSDGKVLKEYYANA